MLGDVHHDAVSHTLPSEGSTSCSWNQRSVKFSSKVNEFLDIRLSLGKSDGQGHLAIHRCISGVKRLGQ